MEIGTMFSLGTDYGQLVEDVVAYDRVGLDLALIPEAYTFDAISVLGFLAGRTERTKLGTGIVNIFSRTPTVLAMSAAGLDLLSQGRFVLGVGASGPQVIEGFHGVKYDAPLGRVREVVDICRKVWRREALVHNGKYYQVPLQPDRGGSGLGKPLKLVGHPVRDRIPMLLASIGPKNVALAAELFEAWQPIFYYPEKAEEVFGESLAAGRAKRAPELGDLQVYADTYALVSDDEAAIEGARTQVRRTLALYVGGMGAKGKNFYNDLAVRYGFGEAAEKVQDLFLTGKVQEATASVPDEFIDAVSLIGTPEQVRSRLAAYDRAGVHTLLLGLPSPDHAARLQTVEAIKDFAQKL
ncbi:LLM class F420-dependent oxidoreductase [Granulicoccus phenolivorans]|uniref:LLM class F420-dependent oxidoreductase n=1 Tax=Granulicoccus phenolivorans TaxID=266854 RepID=UPI0003FF611B|nr:LLM class F420-dependent oxidoreductase [Granulicoccus phenolivorans]